MFKTRIFLPAFLGLGLFFNACSNDDDSPVPAKAVANTLQKGNWRITNFNEDGRDETQHFAGYAFTFTSDGKISAVKNGTTVNGSWQTGNHDSNSKINMEFDRTPPFDELSDDWHVLEYSDTKVQLHDESGGNGGTDLLTLEKN